MRMQPVIGITGNSTYIDNRSYPEPHKVNFSPRNISKAVTKAGGIPIILPVNEPSVAAKYADLVDGLILAGGEDISPILYCEDARNTIKATYPKRDEAELAITEQMIESGKPILGICRGLQLLNVIHGGTLYQDLSEKEDVFVKHIQETPSNHPIHTVSVDETSYMATFLSGEIFVNSFHHQVIRKLGDGLRVSAESSDGIIEAIESIDETKNIIAIQWHPENLYYKDDDHMALFENLVLRAKTNSMTNTNLLN